VWDTIAIAEYLNELRPEANMLPAERAARARCRSISGEMHSGFSALRASLPMNLRAKQTNFKVWSSAKADIERITEIWRECLGEWKGPWLFGKQPTIADAFYAPVVTRLLTYGVAVDPASTAFCKQIMAWPDMKSWVADAKKEPEQIEELDVDMDF
jgi:glutathione S-transferase